MWVLVAAAICIMVRVDLLVIRARGLLLSCRASVMLVRFIVMMIVVTIVLFC